ncbi:MAG: tetratricopeptide repeat protein [Spirochaetales bacterium]|nr:tetratricopeptide repeat protein [Spirochaetales bacterium]
MIRPRLTRRAALPAILIFCLGIGSVVAQEGTGLAPVFPEENPGLVFVEGEEAVSTSFAPEPTLNFGCSGDRTLQLSRNTGQQGGRAFSAVYVFYVEQAGTYELWYGGTPPGPEDELFPSYSSPFSYRLDGGEERTVYREDVAVVEQYAPAYYWNRVGELTLEAGAHTLELLVSQGRRHDNRYYFYLDAFFLLRGDRVQTVAEGPLPEAFPGSLADRSIDFPFRSLEDYEISIRDNPGSVEAYLQIVEIYALLGDYLNALRYLKRAELIAPEDPRVRLLLGKVQIWKGDVTEGLKSYRELLLLEPDRPELWLEAGKVAAWIGQYDDSMAFFRSALERFPGDLGLTVNLGLTFLWSGRPEEAEEQFRRAQGLAEKDYRLGLELARVYAVNGYPERGIPVLRTALREYPERLEPYLLLEQIYVEQNDEAGAAEIRQAVVQSFQPSERLQSYLEIFRTKQALRDEVIAGYERQMRLDPENLALRELLAQTYFWNGQRRRAIEEYRKLLANHAFREVTGMDEESLQLLVLLDRAAVYRGFLEAVPAGLKAVRTRLEAALAAFSAAQDANQAYLDRVAAARERGEEPPGFKGEDPALRLQREQAAFGLALDRAEALVELAGRLLASRERDHELLPAIEAAEAEISESFARVVEPIRWQWERRDFLGEFAALDSVLARYVLGRIALSEGRLGEAEALFRGAGQEEAVPAEFGVALLQSLLWQGRVEEALAIADGRAAGPSADHRPEHWDGLVELGQDVQALAGLSPGLSAEEAPGDAAGPRPVGGDPQARVEGALERLEELAAAVDEAAGRLQADRRTLEGIYGQRMLRAMYRFEENTYLIRNELGGYYLREEDYQAAIRQFRQVLSVDPWNIDAVYRLGKVYEWKGDWSQAMRNYQKVYFTDPAYEDVTAQYNRLAREHADSLEFAAWTLMDTSELNNHAEASFSHPLNSRVGVRLSYEGDQRRSFGGPRSPASYFVQTAALSLPFSLAGGRLELAPVAGGQVVTDLAGGTGVWPAASVEPLAGLDLAASLGRYLYLVGGYRWRRQEDTLAPGLGLPRLFSHFGQLDLSASLGFIPVYPFRHSSARTYASLEAVPEAAGSGNLLYSVAEELTVGLLRLQEPTVDLSLVGNFVFEGSTREVPVDYYAPRGVLLATGGLSASTWFGVGESSAANIALRASAGAYQEGLLTDNPGRKVQVEGQGELGFSRGEAHYYLRGSFSSTYEYQRGSGPGAGWDYWSLYVTLGFSTSLPRLLAP